ncbi:Chromosome partition protein Smc [Azospirillaceae bacterium]
MDFLKLRLVGFKSFVDQTELMIEPGLTGIVGPNGCGKSNLVEALRWVMGETSARKMRGDEMDDVIFGGTARRPPRNLAEVILVLDNHSHTAPAAFNDNVELEVMRRIERGSGSDYRINGRPVRARDVQLMFADNASGSGSPSLVSQGKVGALINAKPQERRQLLEEAAGITGLHSRRHEAELRLRGAETNLTRLEDVIGAMETQLLGLKKQARQATRYRNLSDLIRRSEALLWHLRWRQTESALETAHAGFSQAEERVRRLMADVAGGSTRRTEDAALLPKLRQDEVTAAAALQRLVLAREALESEERRVSEAQEAHRRRLLQIHGDLGREKALADDAGGALDRLNAEREHLLTALEEEEAIEEEAMDSMVATQDSVDALDREVGRLTEKVAADEARRSTLVRQISDFDGRLATLDRRLAEHRQQRESLERESRERPDLMMAEAEVDAAEDRQESARLAAEQAERLKAESETAQTRAREAMLSADAARAKLKAEESALAELLSVGAPNLFPPMIDAVTVTPGYEGALAAAFGEDLIAPLNEAAPVHWRTLPPFADIISLPAGADPLATRVKGPPAIARGLAHVGVVANQAQGRALAGTLQPGQSLVSREGGAWRWDGLTVAAGAPTPAAIRLKQRNRLADLRAELEMAEDAADLARDRYEQARSNASDASQRERQAREAIRAAFTQVTQTRERLAKLAQAAAAAESRLASLNETVERLESDRRDVELQQRELQSALESLPEVAVGRQRLAEERASLAEKRTILAEKRSRVDRLRREAQGRRQRLTAIAAEEDSWRKRQGGAGGRVAELEERAAAAQAELDRLSNRPMEIHAERSLLMDRVSDAERVRKRAADALAEAETRLASTERNLKRIETELSDAREARARAEAAVSTAMQNGAMLRERITERLSCEPQEVFGISGLQPGDEFPEPSSIESRLERLTRERENMGPVNLRAEMEAQELEQQIISLQNERNDLIAAIGRLRQAIANLNREARERLLASFQLVNNHFQNLFTRLFGGGHAKLELTNAEDPLESGLDIYASPPGKRLQNLTLLSGGEQALTALSLLFGVFLTNPAPICVLDEVDAALDEANVGRLCEMLQEMARPTSTRFLVITHHRLTMASLDRLYGVTMLEQGVSQLVSVDLRSAENLRAVG